ncbi:hypothetical protein [Actinopolymorpha rutila]|uniref:Uncharacterized protein n=1 Tax=Actinopolymorpha rutila TaxID=446787 RepID=A0A852ZHA8_9ACTN|nr:hypothetical protein [Actinopolymorpha rutila]NYH87666.1 hypothetical protein [Actinopolymorpha rutila]
MPVCGPSPPGAEEIEAHGYDHVVFVDQGSNVERVNCPHCAVTTSTSWWQDRMDAAYETSFARLDVRMPCCGAETTLNELDYCWPAGFASAELRADSPARGWLGRDEQATVEAVYGHALRQIWARY